MENIAEKMQSLLSDEEGLKQLQSLYDILSGNSKKEDNNESEEPENHDETADSQAGEMPELDLGSILKLQSLFSSDPSENKNTALLTALRPHLSEEKQYKVDKAVKILNLLDMISVLKASGLLNDIL